MKVVIAALLLLTLSACATRSGTYGNLDPCVIDRATEHMTCLEGASAAEITAWEDYHVNTPVLDEGEAKMLSAYKFTAWADLGTTGAGLLVCKGVTEGNPLGLLIPLGKYVHYRVLKKEAERTSRYHSMATGIGWSAVPAGVATTWNASVLSKCL